MRWDQLFSLVVLLNASCTKQKSQPPAATDGSSATISAEPAAAGSNPTSAGPKTTDLLTIAFEAYIDGKLDKAREAFAKIPVKGRLTPGLPGGAMAGDLYVTGSGSPEHGSV